MTPSPEIRVLSLLRTLEDLVIPAVDPGNALAQEQCQLILAQLRMLMTQLPYIGDYHALCRDDVQATTTVLRPVTGGSQTQAAGQALDEALNAAESATDARAAYQRLGFAFEALIRAVAIDGTPAYRARVEAEALAFSRRQARRERTWFKATGFDPHPDTLPSLEQMVAGD